MSGSGRKFLSLEAGRFIAAFLVVLFHVGVTTAQPKYFGHYVVPAFAGGFAGVEFFFVLSGFVIVTAHYSDFGRADRGRVTLTFLWKRFVRLYPALWGVLVVLAPAIFFIKALQWKGSVSVADVVAAFTIAPFPVERILSVEWTLRYEVIFYALFALLLWRRAIGIAGFALLIGLSVASYGTEGTGLAGFFLVPYPLLFLGGALIGWAARARPLRFGAVTLSLGIAIFASRLAVCALHPEHNGARFWDTSIFGAGAALIVYGLVAQEIRRPVPVPGWLRYLGQASYALYLVHFPVVSVGAKLAMRLHSRLPELVLMLMIAALALASGIAYHELIEKRLIAMAKGWQPRSLTTDARSPVTTA